MHRIKLDIESEKETFILQPCPCQRPRWRISTGLSSLVISNATDVQVVEMALASVAAAEALSASPDPLFALEPKRFGARRDSVLVSNLDRDARAPEFPLG